MGTFQHGLNFANGVHRAAGRMKQDLLGSGGAGGSDVLAVSGEPLAPADGSQLVRQDMAAQEREQAGKRGSARQVLRRKRGGRRKYSDVFPDPERGAERQGEGDAG